MAPLRKCTSHHRVEHDTFGGLDCLIDRMAAVVKTLKLPVVSLRFPKPHPGRNFHFHQLGHCGEDNIGQEGETSWTFLLRSRFTTLVNSAPDNFDTIVQHTINNWWFMWFAKSPMMTNYLSSCQHAVDAGGEVLGEELLQTLAQGGQVAANRMLWYNL